ncbi:MAG: DNA primase [Helicobacteraceae bacterium]|jgi:DNA primase|nr:DNA primase [Helicobacteraceae bacterium]
MIKKESVEALKNRVDIVDVVGGYLDLRRSGANYMARCPFHDERTASFSVNSKGFYYCFGCGAKGDVIDFVQNMEKVSFGEAAQKIADMYNFTLEYERGADYKKRDYRPLEALRNFYRDNLSQTVEAKKYLLDRGLGEAMIEKFEIGYAPDNAPQLEFLRSRKIDYANAIAAGVLVDDAERGRFYARFTKRIIFPIYAATGAIVGFGGRTISDHPAKYINSPQSEFFDKSRTLFALPLAREAILRAKSAIVCEGYMDAVMLHQAGFTNAIATLGTALTTDHLPLLKRLENPRVILSYDSDAAGQEAAFKAAKLLAANNFSGGVALFSGGKDPADLVQSGSAEVLARSYENPVPFAKFALQKIIDRAPNPDAAFAECGEFLNNLSDLAYENARMFAAAMLGIDYRRFKRRYRPLEAAPSLLSGRGDINELQVIKTLRIDPALLAALADYLDERIFCYHRDLFRALFSGDERDFYPLAAEERIGVLSAEQTREALRALLVIYYEKELLRFRAFGDAERIKSAQLVLNELKTQKKLAPFREI